MLRWSSLYFDAGKSLADLYASGLLSLPPTPLAAQTSFEAKHIGAIGSGGSDGKAVAPVPVPVPVMPDAAALQSDGAPRGVPVEVFAPVVSIAVYQSVLTPPQRAFLLHLCAEIHRIETFVVTVLGQYTGTVNRFQSVAEANRNRTARVAAVTSVSRGEPKIGSVPLSEADAGLIGASYADISAERCIIDLYDALTELEQFCIGNATVIHRLICTLKYPLDEMDALSVSQPTAAGVAGAAPAGGVKPSGPVSPLVVETDAISVGIRDLASPSVGTALPLHSSPDRLIDHCISA